MKLIIDQDLRFDPRESDFLVLYYDIYTRDSQIQSIVVKNGDDYIRFVNKYAVQVQDE